MLPHEATIPNKAFKINVIMEDMKSSLWLLSKSTACRK
jgi:hypothetical protein